MHDFHLHAQGIKYVQYDGDTFVFISLASALFDTNENIEEHAVVSRLS